MCEKRDGVSWLAKALALVLAFSCVGQGSWGCHEHRNGEVVDAVDGAVDGLVFGADAGEQDAGVPVVIDPTSTARTDCDRDFFAVSVVEQPIWDGWARIGDGWVVTIWEEKPVHREYSFLDVSHCLEYHPFTDRNIWDVDLSPPAHGTVAALMDLRSEETVGAYRLDLSHWTITRLYDLPDEFVPCDVPMTNGRWTVFPLQRVDPHLNQPFLFRGLWVLDGDRDVATAFVRPSGWSWSYAISDGYVAAVRDARTAEGTFGASVQVMDLETMETRVMQPIARGFAESARVALSGHWAVWMETGNQEGGGGYRLVAYDLNRAESRVLLESPRWILFSLDRGLLVWSRDQRVFDGADERFVGDLIAVDMVNGVMRRLNEEPTECTPGNFGLDTPYMLLNCVRDESPDGGGIYLVNLRKMGVVNRAGRLLPGGPVLSDLPL